MTTAQWLNIRRRERLNDEMMTGISRCRFFHVCPSGDHLDLPANRIENTHVLASENKVEGAKAGSA
ncbi:hypothetical protein J0664_21655 [Rhizobium leguminosarum]|uniref:hypothetical protein n=1 Tax=Rhizobium leguminosarum TaxID=384 RepID=UPI001A919B27|nr:hypothetical protein [Rhizobium leguminosarum]QSW26141.1 hypothetical protein J0664_21655 [Rhizobium leguminosarum]